MIQPLFKKTPIYLRYSLFHKIISLFKLPLLIVIKEFFSSRLLLSRKRFSAFLHASHYISIIKDHPEVQKIFSRLTPGDILYFFWGRGVCEIIPFVNTKGAKSVIRLHGFDLYEDRNNGYFPFRKLLFERTNAIIHVSSFGKEYLSNLYPAFKTKFHEFRLGTLFEGKSNPSKDNIFRIASCGRVVPLKRYSLILEALHKFNIPIHWHHLGDGPLLNELKINSQTLPGNIKTFFHGWVNPKEVKKFYISNPIDLFVHVSETEGLPVSIMEALSCGIPVLATDVGGTREIIDSSVGKLLPADITPNSLFKEIETFLLKEMAEKKEIRNSALLRFESMCNAQSLAKDFIRFLKTQPL